jgi:predicted Zn-ribbon and HTH transcriptional regulator
MVCPQCGGKMTFTPDGTSLTCEFCSSRKQLATADKSPVGEEDFLLALATQKGHLQTFQSQTQTCQGCGARFFLNPQQISSTCPYCDSSHVITDQSNQDIIIPNSLIPFKLNERMARSVFSDWLKKNLNEDEIERTSGKGIYIPIWTFDVGGSINWTYEIYKNKRWIPLSDAKLLLVNDLPIPASQNFEQIPAQLTQSFDLDQLVPFDPGYLSSWMAETHDASLSEASLRARQITLQNERVAINAGISEQSRNLTIRSDQMMIDSYRLALIPVWVCHYWLKGKRYDVFLNGDSGEVFGDLPLLNPRRWLAGFF